MLCSCHIYAVAVNWDFGGDFIEAKMIASGIPLDEPYLQDRLFDIAKEEMKSLKGGKLFVDGCHYVIGTADPTGILNRGEVCVILYVFCSHITQHILFTCFL